MSDPSRLSQSAPEQLLVERLRAIRTAACRSRALFRKILNIKSNHVRRDICLAFFDTSSRHREALDLIAMA